MVLVRGVLRLLLVRLLLVILLLLLPMAAMVLRLPQPLPVQLVPLLLRELAGKETEPSSSFKNRWSGING